VVFVVLLGLGLCWVFVGWFCGVVGFFCCGLSVFRSGVVFTKLTDGRSVFVLMLIVCRFLYFVLVLYVLVRFGFFLFLWFVYLRVRGLVLVVGDCQWVFSGCGLSCWLRQVLARLHDYAQGF